MTKLPSLNLPGQTHLIPQAGPAAALNSNPFFEDSYSEDGDLDNVGDALQSTPAGIIDMAKVSTPNSNSNTTVTANLNIDVNQNYQNTVGSPNAAMTPDTDRNSAIPTEVSADKTTTVAINRNSENLDSVNPGGPGPHLDSVP